MSCTTGGWKTKNRTTQVLVGVAILGSLLVLFLLSQPPDAAHPSSHFSGAIATPTIPRPTLVPAVVAPKPIAAPVAPIAVATAPAGPSPVLRSERVWRLRVFGITVFRYDTKVEGPRK